MTENKIIEDLIEKIDVIDTRAESLQELITKAHHFVWSEDNQEGIVEEGRIISEIMRVVDYNIMPLVKMLENQLKKKGEIYDQI